MPRSYFYHLAFELYPTLHERQTPADNTYLPPPGVDIFLADLPAHTISRWSGSPPERPSHKRTNTDSAFANSRSRSFPQLDHRRPDLRAFSLRPKNANHVNITEDWRLDRITIESIDMDIRTTEGGSRPRGKSMHQEGPADAAAGGGPGTRARFLPADPKNTDIGYGVVHLYRDVDETKGLYDVYEEEPSNVALSATFKEEDCTTLCILAVPSYMMPSDLLGWAGEQSHEDVSHFRLIRTSKVNRYMVLIKFRDAKKARLWREEYNGRPFSSMEPEIAHVVFVQSIAFKSDDGSLQPTSFPSMNDDPLMPKTQPTAKVPVSTASEISNALTTRPLAPPPPNLVELPTCPVCLERMDETTGLLTILCQHVFHCDCLSKWRGSGCPVCRYTQNGPSLGSLRNATSPSDAPNVCSVCASEQSNWICLICGNVGCGRYDSAHAYAHFKDTGHAFAMDIASQHVWDYVGDGYVHRLIQNKADGKMMDLPDASSTKPADGGMAAVGADLVPREKMEAMGNEYSYLLQSQLENQRSYFEDQLDRALEKAGKAAAAAERAAADLAEVDVKFEALRADHERALESVGVLERDLQRVTTKLEKTDALAKKLARDWKEEKVVNEGLMERVRVQEARIKDGETQVAELRAEKEDLAEQNRDLSFFISGAEKLKELKEQGEDVEGTVEVAPSTKGKGRRRKK